MIRLALIGVAGAAGALTRYGLGTLVGTQHFPWMTLAINASGSFVLAALLAGPLATRLSSTAMAALAVGFLGAYTTFSTFGYETVGLVRDGRPAAAASYAFGSLALGLAATALGVAVGQAATR